MPRGSKATCRNRTGNLRFTNTDDDRGKPALTDALGPIGQEAVDSWYAIRAGLIRDHPRLCETLQNIVNGWPGLDDSERTAILGLFTPEVEDE